MFTGGLSVENVELQSHSQLRAFVVVCIEERIKSKVETSRSLRTL